jgi:hypothetical protein
MCAMPLDSNLLPKEFILAVVSVVTANIFVPAMFKSFINKLRNDFSNESE